MKKQSLLALLCAATVVLTGCFGKKQEVKTKQVTEETRSISESSDSDSDNK